MTSLPQITFGLLRRFGATAFFPAYESALVQACRDFPPPFGNAEYGDVYRAAASDPGWLAISMITNAEREGDGAERLWSLSACTEDEPVGEQIKQHAIDESNHSKIYLKMVDLVFPGAVEPGFRRQMECLSPYYTRSMVPVAKLGSPFAHSITLDDLVQMNIAEIRTTIHHLLQRPMLRAHCSSNTQPGLIRLQQCLLRDEIKHVAYTAQLIEDRARQVGVDAVFDLFRERLRDFNNVTLSELQDRVFDVS